MRACIFGAGEYFGESLALCEGAVIIAADGGFSHTEAHGLSVSLAIGDFDSLGEMPSGVRTRRHPVEKDDTDMALAVKEALRMGCDELILFGALGGRLDHTLANITLLLSLAKQGVSAYLVGKNAALTVLAAGEALRFEGCPDGILSLFSLSSEATVTLEDVKYPLSSGKLYADTALGVSNHFLKKTAYVGIESGFVLVYWENGGELMPKRERSEA